ncbi:MAG: hypothetical protein AB1629_05995 [Candidatus Omnitrophota bacterium]
MIELNFLPLDLRKKKRAAPIVPSGLPIKIFWWVLGIIIAIHLLLILIMLGEKFYLKTLEAKLNEKMPKTKETLATTKEINNLQDEQTGLSKLFGKRIIWAKKLNTISNKLPSGIWLNRIIITDTLFSMEGSSVSLKAEEMKSINEFLASLKEETDFVVDFGELALKSIQRRSIKTIEVVDFIIAGLLKQ